jgi:DNA-binding MarR family transcriptional regulator
LRLTAPGRRSAKSLALIAARADTDISAAFSADERRRFKALLQAVLRPHFDPPPPADLAELTGWLVAQCRLRLEVTGDALLAPMALTVRTFVALAILAARAPCSQQDLAAELDIGPASTVELIDELEQLGTVERSRNPHDRRSYALALTPAGETLLAQARAALVWGEREFTSMLSEADRAELVRLLAKLAGAEAGT